MILYCFFKVREDEIFFEDIKKVGEGMLMYRVCKYIIYMYIN